MPKPLLAVRMDPDLIEASKQAAQAASISWPEWLADAIRAKLTSPPAPSPIEATKQRIANLPPRPLAQIQRWNAKPSCKVCGAPLSLGKCQLGCK